MNNKKNSLLSGALVGSLGIFISKALGLFYVVPLNYLAGASNMAFYSITYNYYDLLLKVCSAGIPFAIASLVAKYYGRGDYKTVRMVRKIGTSFIMALSFAVAVLFFLISKPLAGNALGAEATSADINNLINLFHILLIALIFVPLLSSIRGYYQGLKRLDIYSSSQIIEQFIRVFSIIFLGYIAVKIFNFDGIYAIYMAILAAGIAAILTILYFFLAAKDEEKEMQKLLASQNTEALDTGFLIKEIINLGLPYVAISFLGTTSPLIDTNFFISYATNCGIGYEEAKIALGAIQVNCNKIASIPQVLTLGFSAGLVPYLSESYERYDIKKIQEQLNEIFITILYILIPVILTIMLFSKPIYYIMYGSTELAFTSSLLGCYSLVALSDTIAPVFSSVLITLRFRRNAIIFLLIGIIIKCLSFFGLIPLIGAYGLIVSTFLASSTVIVLAAILLRHNFKFNLRKILKIAFISLVIALIAIIPFLVLNHYFNFNFNNRILCLIHFGIEIIFMLLIYLFISDKLGLINEIFHIDKLSFKDFVMKFLKR